MPTSLAEDYRPDDWKDLAGVDDVISRINRLRRRGLTGRAYYIAGPTGTGKTTIARMLAKELADSWSTFEIDAQKVSMEFCDWAERQQYVRPLGRGVNAFIVNEIHGLRKQIVSRLLTMLDPVPETAIWVFTTTPQGRDVLFEHADAGPFYSRCVDLSPDPRDLELAFAVRAQEIAQREQLDGRPLSAYVDLARRCGCNLRLMLQKIDAGAMLFQSTPQS